MKKTKTDGGKKGRRKEGSYQSKKLLNDGAGRQTHAHSPVYIYEDKRQTVQQSSR